MKYNNRVDVYIEKAEPFARPILTHLRQVVHATIPDVEETIKWGMPCFDYKGILASMASFKAHCSFGFWKATLMKDKDVLLTNQSTSMGHIGKITSIDQLPPDKVLENWLLEAKDLNDRGIKLETRKKSATSVECPPELEVALSQNVKARKVYESFPPSHRKEYNLWIAEAKTQVTRDKRIVQAIEWMTEGKHRHWKYDKC